TATSIPEPAQSFPIRRGLDRTRTDRRTSIRIRRRCAATPARAAGRLRGGTSAMKPAFRNPVLHEFEGWLLSPEGAAIHLPEQTVVIADVHLGYEWARGASGDCVPAHSLKEALEQLGHLLNRAQIVRLIVAGDLLESARPCARTEHDVRQLRAWLAD